MLRQEFKSGVVITRKNSVVNQYLRELRDVEIQKDSKRFARNLERIGAIAGYELSKRLNYKKQVTKTPLGEANTPLIKDKVVVATILRAGLPLQKGVASVFDGAELAFIAAGRKPDIGHGVEIDLAYVASPKLEGKVLIIADTMLASGRSIIDAYNSLLEHGKPSRVFIISAIASQPGVDYVQKNIRDVEIITAALDPELNDQFFIVPGLGDAGDLLYGEKH
jgi:uracil phosphoribosyltransferase